jgi:hypothetical protein
LFDDFQKCFSIQYSLEGLKDEEGTIQSGNVRSLAHDYLTQKALISTLKKVKSKKHVVVL